MKNHWKRIIKFIENKHEIQEKKDWEEDNKLTDFQISLEQKLKERITKDNVIAQYFFLDTDTYQAFISKDTEARKKTLNKLLSSNIPEIENIKIDKRTLKKHLMSESEIEPNQLRIKNIFAIYMFNSLYEQSILNSDIFESQSEDQIETEYRNNRKMLKYKNTSCSTCFLPEL